MASFLEKLEKFFSEPVDEEFLALPPIDYEGKQYAPYREENDQYAVWPNAYCLKCKGLYLKKTMFFNKESETFIHNECPK